jgi:hypothetical protein
MHAGASLIMSSSPSIAPGIFREIWEDAIKEKNEYTHHLITWDSLPHRNDDFKRETQTNIGIHQWMMEYECNFIDKDNHQWLEGRIKT